MRGPVLRGRYFIEYLKTSVDNSNAYPRLHVSGVGNDDAIEGDYGLDFVIAKHMEDIHFVHPQQ